jgi:GlpG protein
MRHIGTEDDPRAARGFLAYLRAQGIPSKIIGGADGASRIMVIEEEHVDRARDLYAEFREQPDDPRYEAAAREAPPPAPEPARPAPRRRASVDMRARYQSEAMPPLGLATAALIVICVVVAIASNLGRSTESLQFLFITEFDVEGGYIRWLPGLPEFRSGQAWRLVTPMFIHFGFVHILFNMMWLADLGSRIERASASGAVLLLSLVLVSSAASNVAQYAFTGPSFGGMSGVVYALLGYMWMKTRYDPGSGLYLRRTLVMWMLAWFAICWTPIIPNVANWAHAAGLAVGTAWGFASAKLRMAALRR